MGNQLKDALKAAGLVITGATESANNGPETSRMRKAKELQWTGARNGDIKSQQSPSHKSGRPESFLNDGNRQAALIEITVPTLNPEPKKKAHLELHLDGDFNRNPVLVEDELERESLPEIEHSGIVRQISDTPDNATDLVIGLDFGTSTTKVVIRDAYASVSVFPVELNDSLSGINIHLLPSRVFRTGDKYSISGGEHRISNLKLRLLQCESKDPESEFNDCCAYLALVIRRSRGWLLTRHRDVYSRHELKWKVNLGLAARSYEDADTVRVFSRLAWAAANLASDKSADTITTDIADTYRRESKLVYSPDHDASESPDREFSKTDVSVVPEVCAQLQGFMWSARWDWLSRPVMMLVDIGAGTIDSALFHVGTSINKKKRLTFFANRVEQNGVMNLHRSRVDWLLKHLPEGDLHDDARQYLMEMEKPTDRRRPIPELVMEYLPGYTKDPALEDFDSDFFIKRYRTQVARSINDAKIGKRVCLNQLQNVPLLLCGGGSRMTFYAVIADAINNTPGWHVSVEVMRLPVPIDLSATGWHSDEFDRISVAYGLSLSGESGSNLEEIVKAMDVPPLDAFTGFDRSDTFVSKDHI